MMAINTEGGAPLCPKASEGSERSQRDNPGVPTNRIGYVGGLLHTNGAALRVLMTPNRLRIGCTEISLEAARAIMAHHERRFGTDENWVSVQ